MSIIRSNIVDRAEEGLRVVDEASNSLPSKDEVRWEIERLQHNLSKLRYPSSAGSGRSGDNIPNLAVTSYHTELEKMCGQIEGARDETERRRFLDDILSQADDSSTDIDNEVDIRAELSHAWTLDQAALLTARENVMNEVVIAIHSIMLQSHKVADIILILERQRRYSRNISFRHLLNYIRIYLQRPQSWSRQKQLSVL